jgi:hypothetical protein
MKRVFRSLNDEDHFGFICIGKDSDMPCPQLNLQKKSLNYKAKREFLIDICDDNHFFKVVSNLDQVRQRTKLNDALHTAIEW